MPLSRPPSSLTKDINKQRNNDGCSNSNKAMINTLLAVIIVFNLTVLQLSIQRLPTDISSELSSIQEHSLNHLRGHHNKKEEHDSTTDNIARMSDGRYEWWVEKRSLEDYERELEAAIAKYRANNEDELSIVTALGERAVLEIEDGREFHALEVFYNVWKSEQPFSGEPFFDWLDFGSGRNADCDKCKRSKVRFGERKYATFSDAKRESAEVDIVIGDDKTLTLTYKKSGEPVPTGEYSFVWGTDRRLYIVQDGKVYSEDGNGSSYTKIGHASFFGGKPVLHAGEIGVEDGKWLWIDPRSGHYRPKLHNIRNCFLWLRDDFGATRDSIEWRPLKKSSDDSWDAVFE